MRYTSRLTKAFDLAIELHQNQKRKGGEIPYITHLLAVAALVGEHGGDEEQLIAALLHDAVEDQGGQPTLEKIRENFGDRVAELVLACSDTDVSPKPPWRERKEAHIKRMAEADIDARLIIAADKLHNARTMLNDQRRIGDSLWNRFTGGKEGTLWYLDASLRALSDEWSHPILEELADVLMNLRDNVWSNGGHY